MTKFEKCELGALNWLELRENVGFNVDYVGIQLFVLSKLIRLLRNPFPLLISELNDNQQKASITYIMFEKVILTLLYSNIQMPCLWSIKE